MLPRSPTELKRLATKMLGHTVVRNALLLYLVQFSGYIMPLLTLPYLSRVLSTENFGLVAFSQTFAWYFIILTEYGFNLVATREIAVHRDSPERVSAIFSEVMVAKTLLTVIGFLILLITVATVPALRPHWQLFLISFGAVVGNLLFPLWLYQGLQKMQHVAIRDFASKLVSLVALFMLVRSDRDYLLAAGAQSAGFLLAGFAGLLTVPWQLNVHFRWPSVAGVRAQLRVGWPAFLSLAVATFSTVTNQFILGVKGPASEVAYFSVSNRLISAMRTMVTPLSSAIFPHVSGKAALSELEAIRFVRKYAMLFAAPFLLAGLFLLAGAPWLVPALLGAKYTPAVAVIQIMAMTPLLHALIQIFSVYYMLACGYDKAWMRIMLTNVAINFAVLGPALFLFRGSVALALTGLAADGFATVLYWMFYRRKVREHGNDLSFSETSVLSR